MIYFLQGSVTKNIKIGYTDNDFSARFQSISSSDILICLKTAEGSKDEERLLQERFRYAHSHGEWFIPVPELLKYVESLMPSPWDGQNQSGLAPWERHITTKTWTNTTRSNRKKTQDEKDRFYLVPQRYFLKRRLKRS